MSVKTKLFEMSDSGKFETVASAVLRRANSHYRSAIQTGINAEEKPIADPVDGLGLVEKSDPPHYILFEYTTTKRSDLDYKWLNDPEPDTDQSPGDLIKAAEIASEIRSETPDAEFTVVLVSNRVPHSDTVRAVYAKAETLDLSIDLWGLHELSDFLSNDPDGQYIRNKYFGIDEERLSESLLLDLTHKSIHSYQELFHIRIDNSSIERPEVSTILDTAQSSKPEHYFVPILGNSGFGKTVTCYQAMVHWQKGNSPALRLDPDDIQGANSLSQALQFTLERLYPTLSSSAGQDAIQIAKEGNPLLIVVDDLNQTDNPSRFLSKIRNWVSDTTDSHSLDSAELPVTILCPLWPRIWAREERNLDRSKFAEPIELGPLSSAAAAQLVQLHAEDHDVDIDEQKASSLAEKVGRDPHLIGLLGSLLGRGINVENLPDTSREVLDQYVEYSYETASEASNTKLIPPDFRIAVEDFSHDVMKNRELEPEWRTVKQWSESGSNNLKQLRRLTTQAQLLILLQGKTQTISFRHDRLRDYLLALYSFEQITPDEEPPEYLSDPYYHSILGKGVAYFRPPKELLAQLRENNPIALFEALNELDGDSDEYERAVSNEIQRWLDQEGGYQSLLRSSKNEILDILYEVKSDQVLEITNSFWVSPHALLARFRNGDLNAGIQYCNTGSLGSPNTNNSQRDSVFDDAAQKWGNQYADTLSDTLPSIDSQYLVGALRLAGFMGKSELMSGIESCWEENRGNQELLPAFLWAAFRCGIPDYSSVVDEMLSEWVQLPDGDSIERRDDRTYKWDIYFELKFSLIRDISKEQTQYLINAIDSFEAIESYILQFLNRIPDPDALEILTRKVGEFKRSSDGSWYWPMSLLDPWDPRTTRGKRLPQESKARMRKIWSNTDERDEVRTVAFRLWAKSAQDNEIGVLVEARQDEIFKNISDYHRLRIGDKSIIRSQPDTILEKSHYLRQLPNVWCEDSYELVDRALTQVQSDQQDSLVYDIGHVLFRIPQADAEKLLAKHWQSVGDNSMCFQAALYTATTRTKELTHKTYRDSNEPSNLFNHLGMHFGFKVFGRAELISQKHLFVLEPYLDDLDEMDLIEIAEKAYELGLDGWSEDCIRPHLSDKWKQHYYPTDEDLIQEFDQLKRSEEVLSNVRGWMMRFDHRTATQTHVFEALDKWLRNDVDVSMYRVASEIIRNWGTREELSILYNPSEWSNEMEEIYTDVKLSVEIHSLS